MNWYYSLGLFAYYMSVGQKSKSFPLVALKSDFGTICGIANIFNAMLKQIFFIFVLLGFEVKHFGNLCHCFLLECLSIV